MKQVKARDLMPGMTLLIRMPDEYRNPGSDTTTAYIHEVYGDLDIDRDSSEMDDYFQIIPPMTGPLIYAVHWYCEGDAENGPKAESDVLGPWAPDEWVDLVEEDVR